MYTRIALLPARVIVVLTIGNPHPLAAPSGAGLDHDRVADFLRYLDRLLGRGNHTLASQVQNISRRETRVSALLTEADEGSGFAIETTYVSLTVSLNWGGHPTSLHPTRFFYFFSV